MADPAVVRAATTDYFQCARTVRDRQTLVRQIEATIARSATASSVGYLMASPSIEVQDLVRRLRAAKHAVALAEAQRDSAMRVLRGIS
jgi:hypothetical protein